MEVVGVALVELGRKWRWPVVGSVLKKLGWTLDTTPYTHLVAPPLLFADRTVVRRGAVPALCAAVSANGRLVCVASSFRLLLRRTLARSVASWNVGGTVPGMNVCVRGCGPVGGCAVGSVGGSYVVRLGGGAMFDFRFRLGACFGTRVVWCETDSSDMGGVLRVVAESWGSSRTGRVADRVGPAGCSTMRVRW